MSLGVTGQGLWSRGHVGTCFTLGKVDSVRWIDPVLDKLVMGQKETFGDRVTAVRAGSRVETLTMDG